MKFKGNLAALPIIDKEVMMEHFDTLNTVHISKEEAFHVAFEAEKTRNFSPTIRNITVGLSSGTSGNRGVFLVSEEEQTLWAGSIIGKVLPSSILHKHTIAFSYVQIAIYMKRQKISESHFIFLIY